MTAPDLLERTRMALAEVGYDPSRVTMTANGTIRTWGNIPRIDRWRATSIARASGEKQICFECRDPLGPAPGCAAITAARAACLADRPLVRDCGVTR